METSFRYLAPGFQVPGTRIPIQVPGTRIPTQRPGTRILFTHGGALHLLSTADSIWRLIYV